MIAIDLEDRKLAMERSFGAKNTFNPKADDVVAKVKEVTGGRGADSAIDWIAWVRRPRFIPASTWCAKAATSR